MAPIFDGLADVLEELPDYGRATEELEQCHQGSYSQRSAQHSPNTGKQAAYKRAPNLTFGAVQDVNVVQYERIFDGLAEAFIVYATAFGVSIGSRLNHLAVFAFAGGRVLDFGLG